MLAVALLHYPIVNKEDQATSTSVTNFDIHDIARASCTYGVARYFIVTPIELQRDFVQRIVTHWREGPGAQYNPTRKESLLDTVIVRDLIEVGDAIERDFGSQPFWIATTAKTGPDRVTCAEVRERLDAGENICLIFGTGYGLHPQVMLEVDAVLEPIEGPTPFNHLSVRSAVSIYLDRLLGRT